MSNLELLERAAAATTCQVLGAAGGALVQVGAWGAFTGGPALVPIGAGALALLAANYGCSDMPLGEAIPGGINGCGQMAPGGYGESQRSTDGGDTWYPFGDGIWGYRQVTAISKGEITQGNFGTWRANLTISYVGGTIKYSDSFNKKEWAEEAQYRIDPIVGECQQPETPPPAPLPPTTGDTYNYTDNVTNCNYTVVLQGFIQPNEYGPISPVYLIEGAPQTRAGGGVMGGCNFPPTIYSPPPGGGGGGGGGGGYLPVPDGGAPPDGPGGAPWWAAPLLAGATAAVVDNAIDAIVDALTPPVPEGEFTLTAPCDIDEQGQALTRTWNFPAQNADQRLLAHQQALFEVLQQHLEWKTPTCRANDKTPLEGTWISTRWESDGISPGGTKPLRKLFRYRSKSVRTADELQTYWRDFVWEAGPVIVFHKGAWWGTPKVWAASEEEGKRVIRFAAGEAGIDPDTLGEWGVSSSRDARYGMSGRMRLQEHQGERWVTRRDGPSGLPEL